MTTVSAILSLAAGLSVGVQTALMGRFGQRIGVVPAVAFIGVGSAVSSVVLFIVVLGTPLGIGPVFDAPRWMWSAGLLGVIYFSCVTLAVPRIGAAATIGFFIAGQLAIGFLVDYFGLFGVERIDLTWARLISVVLVAAGATLALRR